MLVSAVAYFSSRSRSSAVARGREGEREMRALSRIGGLDDEIAPVHRGDALRDKEPEPEAVARLGGEEAVEDVGQHVLRDARSFIDDLDPHPLAVELVPSRHLHMNGRTARRMFD